MTKPRILNIDIETSPNRAYTWGLWQQNVAINQIIEPGRVLCFAAKWYGEKKVIFASEHHDGRKEMLDLLWELMNEADAVLGYNTASFDVKHINREFVENGYLPPTDYKHIDLLRVVRKNFKFPSNKLDYISQRLDIGEKVKHYGFELWRDVLNGCPKAWGVMKRYNKKDVQLVEDAYEILRPWINTPTLNVGLFGAAEVLSCPRCGSESLTPESKPYRTKTSTYKQHRCNDCGFVARERQADPDAVKPELV